MSWKQFFYWSLSGILLRLSSNIYCIIVYKLYIYIYIHLIMSKRLSDSVFSEYLYYFYYTRCMSF